MNGRSRRRFLARGGMAVSLTLAGCLRPRNLLPTDRGADPDEYAIVQSSAALDHLKWRENGAAGYLDAFGSADTIHESLDLEALPEERRREVESFVADTDFGETGLLYVTSAGPSTCYAALDVRELAVDGTTLTGVVAAVDTSEGGVDCGAAETHPSALLRPEFDRRFERVEMTVIDGWGDRETIERPVE